MLILIRIFILIQILIKIYLILMLILSLIWILNAGQQTIHCFSKALLRIQACQSVFEKNQKKLLMSIWNYGLILQMASIFNRFPNIYLYVHYTNKCLRAIENPKSIVNNCKIVYRVEINLAFLKLSKDD